MSARILAVVLGLPPRERDRHRQNSRKPERCHPITVSGFTTTRTWVQRFHARLIATQKSRSKRFNRGRGRFLLRTASCCRRAMISRAASRRLRKKTLPAANRVKTNSIMEPNVLTPVASRRGLSRIAPQVVESTERRGFDYEQVRESLNLPRPDRRRSGRSDREPPAVGRNAQLLLSASRLKLPHGAWRFPRQSPPALSRAWPSEVRTLRLAGASPHR